MDVLLIEPDYKSTYPPIGLMKISYFHKYICEDYVRFAKGKLPQEFSMKKWDRVYVTTLFTFEWEKTKEALQYALTVVKEDGHVYTGGVLATLMPDLIAKEFPTVINNTGLLNHTGTLGLPREECIDTLPLDYSMLDDVKDVCTYPAHDAYFTYTTRGCGMNCTFCAVKTLEPKYEPYLSITDNIKRINAEFGPKRDLLLMDNNVLRSPNFNQIVDEIKSLGFQKGATYISPVTGNVIQRHVDFNQGLDAFLLTREKAQRLGELAIKPARIAFDHIEDKDVYIRAITYCAESGIDYMSNYLLYNGVDFTGKGHQYHADTPQDLYERMRITMELGEGLTEKLGRKISIFSFPMRYIPLDNLHRGFIGTNWNAKYLRALQCMLVPTQGKGVSGRSFFEADFGKDVNEFMEALAMPERLLNKRGFFEERKKESEEERSTRYQTWSENHALIESWRSMFNKVDKDAFIEIIAANRFDEQKINEISDDTMKKLYFMYFSVPGMIRVLSVADEHSVSVLSAFVLEEQPALYRRMVEYSAQPLTRAGQLRALAHAFGTQYVKDFIATVDIFSANNARLFVHMDKAIDSLHTQFSFQWLNFIPLMDSVGTFSDADKRELRDAANALNGGKLRKILLNNLDAFKKKLVEKNCDQPGSEQVIASIEDTLQGVYEQLSLFE